MSRSSVGYLELLRSNVPFRRLWAAAVISLFGDWFNTLALYVLVADLTGSPLALGIVFICKMLPLGLASPFAGVLVDRFDRRTLLLVSDASRSVVVLFFLLIDEPSEVLWLYALIAFQVVLGSVFEPARSASIPNLTRPRELLTANALSAATWSVMLALGAAVGGWATDLLGVRTIFVLDSLTYLVSAWFVAGIQIPQATRPAERALWRVAIGKVVEGWSYLRSRPDIGRFALAKAGWALGGGGLVYMLAWVGEVMSPGRAAMAMGLLYSARGLGTGVGPILARAFLTRPETWPVWIGGFIVASGCAYATLSLSPWLWPLMLGLVFFAHAASGANWVLSMVILQERAVDEQRGRVFATEWLWITLADSISIAVASALLEQGLGLRPAMTLFAGVQVFTGFAWWWGLRSIRPRDSGPAGAPARSS